MLFFVLWGVFLASSSLHEVGQGGASWSSSLGRRSKKIILKTFCEIKFSVGCLVWSWIVIEVMTLSGHLSIIDEIWKRTIPLGERKLRISVDFIPLSRNHKSNMFIFLHDQVTHKNVLQHIWKWYFVIKIFLTYCEKKLI